MGGIVVARVVAGEGGWGAAKRAEGHPPISPITPKTPYKLLPFVSENPIDKNGIELE